MVAEARRRVFCFSLAPGGGRAAPKKEKVVIVGGSFSGLRAQRELSPRCGGARTPAGRAEAAQTVGRWPRGRGSCGSELGLPRS